MKNLTDIKELTLETLVNEIKKAKEAIVELEGAEKVLKDEVLDRMKAMRISGTRVNNTLITVVKRILLNDFPLSKAIELGAVKSVIDQDKLRRFISKGIKIPHKTISFITLKEVDKE